MSISVQEVTQSADSQAALGAAEAAAAAAKAKAEEEAAVAAKAKAEEEAAAAAKAKAEEEAAAAAAKAKAEEEAAAAAKAGLHSEMRSYFRNTFPDSVLQHLPSCDVQIVDFMWLLYRFYTPHSACHTSLSPRFLSSNPHYNHCREIA
jgi:hypothetical protein